MAVHRRMLSSPECSCAPIPPAGRQAIPRSAATVRCRGNVRSDLAAGTRAALRSHRPPRVLLERLLEASVLSRRPKLLHVLKLKLKLKFVMTITSVRGPAHGPLLSIVGCILLARNVGEIFFYSYLKYIV